MGLQNILSFPFSSFLSHNICCVLLKATDRQVHKIKTRLREINQLISYNGAMQLNYSPTLAVLLLINSKKANWLGLLPYS